MASSTADKPQAAKASPAKASRPKVETVDDLRQETAGVKTPIKADFDNPESPLIYDPKAALVAPADPDKLVKVETGETAAQHEAHVQLSGPAVIAERLEAEAGPDGVATDVIARQQHERAAKLEFQRVDGGTSLLSEDVNTSKLEDRKQPA